MDLSPLMNAWAALPCLDSITYLLHAAPVLRLLGHAELAERVLHTDYVDLSLHDRIDLLQYAPWP